METARGKTREETINRLADRIDSFEKYTQPHARLMAELATRLGRRFGLGRSDVDAIAEAAMLHDIGLYAMSPVYHSLPRPLSFEARLDLWRHPVIGEQQMAKREASRHAQLLVRWHHEWWNGTGYPDMLAFEDIPVGARILRAVELYSSLLCERPYREAMDDEQATEALTASAGVECDPYVVKALLTLLNELRDTTEEPEQTGLATPLEFANQNSSTAEPEPTEPFASPASPATDQFDPSLPAAEFQAGPSGGAISNELWPVAGVQPIANVQPIAEASPEIAETTNAQTSGVVEQAAGTPPINEAFSFAQPIEQASKPHLAEMLLSRIASRAAEESASEWRAWRSPRYNKKVLLGFQASVLRQIEFRSIAFPFWSEARLDLYLKTWGKVIFANDPRAWAAAVARANVELGERLGEENVSGVLEDVYVPRVNLSNPELRRWFGETDSWWMDNLRRNIDRLSDENLRAQALTLGVHTGDYALSFDEETRELRRPLTTVFWRLAGRTLSGPQAQPHNRSFNQPAEDFIKHARADMLFLSLPSSHTDVGGADARSDWRESWVKASTSDTADKVSRLAPPPQSRASCLASIDRLLRSALHFKSWAIEYHEPGLATAQDIVDLVKEYRPVRATYSKDVTEVAGGLRSCIVVGERTSAR